MKITNVATRMDFQFKLISNILSTTKGKIKDNSVARVEMYFFGVRKKMEMVNVELLIKWFWFIFS